MTVITCALTCKSLIYRNKFVNCTSVQAYSADIWLTGALERGSALGRGDGLDCGFDFVAGFYFRMKDLGEYLQAGYQARSGTGEITVGVDRVDTGVADGWNVLPTRW